MELQDNSSKLTDTAAGKNTLGMRNAEPDE